MAKRELYRNGNWSKPPYLKIPDSIIQISCFEYRKCNFEREDEEVLTKKAQMEEFMFLGLRMTNGISRADFKEAFGMEIEGAYGPALAKLTSEGYLEKREGRIFFTEAGIDVSNTLLTEFLL